MMIPVSLAVIGSLLLGVAAEAPELSEVNPNSCVGNSSLSCLSQKIISAFRRIRKIPEIPVTEWVSLVPSPEEENSTAVEEKPVVESRFRRQGLLWTIGEAVDDFLFSRSVRIALPNWASGSGRAIDLDVARAFTQVTGRGKKHGGKGGKMGMMACMMIGKMMMLTMGMVKMKAMKAMMVAGMAMMLSLGQMMKFMLGGKGGGGGGETKHVIVIKEHEHGGGGGGAAPSSSYGPPSSGGGGGWSGGGGGGGGGWASGGGGGGGGGWQGGGGGGGDSGGGYNYDPPASGGWGKRAYHYDTYITHPPNSAPNTTNP